MKAWGTLLSIVALVSAAPSGLETRGLQDDLQDFVAVLPQEQIAQIVALYVSCDKEVGAIAKYLQSDDYQTFLLELDSIPEVIELRKYLQDSGLAVRDAENRLCEAFDLRTTSLQTAAGNTSPTCDQPITGGLSGLIKDIASVLPFDQIKALFVEKMINSPEFRGLVARLTSPEFKSIIERLKANPDLQQIMLKAKADIEALINQVQALIGMYYY